jgi:hypothetical protein
MRTKQPLNAEVAKISQRTQKECRRFVLRPLRILCVLCVLCVQISSAVLLFAIGSIAHAQSSCSSDGQPQPVVLLERFINADCEACWSDPATPKAGARELALDWVLPGAKGDDAPLSSVARRDALFRLEALGRKPPEQSDATRHAVRPGPQMLRVAQGPPVNDYVGTSIALRKPGTAKWSAWLALVETVPAGVEGSPVERNLVRNTFQPPWDGGGHLSKTDRRRLVESRPMQIPEGAKPSRLRVVGWLEDSHGHIRAIAQSQCKPEGAKE